MIDFSKMKLSGNYNDNGVVPVPKHIVFNKEQDEAISDIKNFLLSKESYFTLIGKGGTGKTTVIAGALSGYTNVIGIAISHKAKERLSESIKKCYTFASACGMKVVKNELGEKEFVENKFAKKIPIQTAKYIVIDECSMISKKGIATIEKLRRKDSKVIFLGDFRQLPPIDEGGKDSKTFLVPKQASLKIRMRQGSGNPIIALSDIIAKEIENKTFNPYVLHDNLINNISKETGKGYSYVDNSNFINQFVKDFKEDDSTKFICFRTNTVSYYNKKIREAIYKDVKDVYVPGELVIAQETFFYKEEIALKNSVEYYIESVRIENVKGYECYLIAFKDLDQEIPVLTHKARKLWNKELKFLSTKKRWRDFWPLKEAFAEIDYGYAINTHKSQGSTYKNVYLDFNDILNVSKIENKQKCQSLYVAITRASHNLHLLDLESIYST